MFASAGHYHYEGREITATSLKDPAFHRRSRREVVLLFQNLDSMLFNPTVFDEIAFGTCQLGEPELEDRVRHCARLCGVEHLLDRPPFKAFWRREAEGLPGSFSRPQPPGDPAR